MRGWLTSDDPVELRVMELTAQHSIELQTKQQEQLATLIINKLAEALR